MNILSNLYQSSSNAYKNLFFVDFVFWKNLSDYENEAFNKFSVRCSSFEPPTLEQSEYEVRFMNHKIDRPAAKITTERKFSLEFRVDEDYDVYKKLNALMKATFDPENGVTKTGIKDLYSEGLLFDTHIYTIEGDMADADGSNNVKGIKLFEFNKCWIESLTPSEFNYSGSEPVKVTASIRFIEYKTPMKSIETY